MPVTRTVPLVALLLALLLFPGATAGGERLKLATTTSTENSGLLSVLLPPFEAECGCDVDVIAVGTGQALELGRRGDVDLVLVHAPELERAFVDEGAGVDRRTFMQNDFVLVGPASDPAGLRGTSDAALALGRITAAGAAFVSRGDESGTHQVEKLLWARAGLSPDWAGYLSAGQGMGAVLTLADEKRAYTLTDRGTWLARKDKLALEVLVQGDPGLLNPYSVILVNPARFDWVAAERARRLADWFCSEAGQRVIGDFRVGGEQLFTPLLAKAK